MVKNSLKNWYNLVYELWSTLLSLLTYYLFDSMYLSKNGQFLPTQSSAYIIYEWSLTLVFNCLGIFRLYKS